MGVEVTGLELALAGRTVVRDAHLSAPPGRVVGVLGPNGSGKSTLLRALFRALAPDAGSVLIGSRDVWRDMSARDAARQTAAVTQEGLMDPTATAAQVVALGRAPHTRGLFGRDRGDRAAAVTALASVGLVDAADRRVGELSGGERQRVHIARALCQSCAVLVLDEPTNHLDVAHQFELLELIAGLELTVVMVLHDLALAMRYCDSVYLMAAGRVVAHGLVHDVLTPDRIAEVFGVHAVVIEHPSGSGRSLVLSPLSHRLIPRRNDES